MKIQNQGLDPATYGIYNMTYSHDLSRAYTANISGQGNSKVESTNNDLDFLKNIAPQQSREFMLQYFNRKLTELSGSPETNLEYTAVVETENDLAENMKNLISLQSIKPGTTEINQTTLLSVLSVSIDDVSNILKSSGNLPEPLQNEFTNLHYTLSDFITRLKSIALTANPHQLETP